MQGRIGSAAARIRTFTPPEHPRNSRQLFFCTGEEMIRSARSLGRRFHASLAALSAPGLGLRGASVIQAEPPQLEKEQLKIGCIERTDMASLQSDYETAFLKMKGFP
jgi:hypothetical protein